MNDVAPASLLPEASALDIDGPVARYRREGFARLGPVLGEDVLAPLRRRCDQIMLGEVQIPGLFFQHDGSTGAYEDLPHGLGWQGPSLAYRKIEKLERDELFAAVIGNALFGRVARAVHGGPVALYRAVVLARVFDAKAVALQRTGRLGTYAASLGQEAVSVGTASAMRNEDVLLPSYRDSRVKAVIPMAGNLANAGMLPAATGVPILHIMDDHDQYDSYSASIAFDRQNVPAPRALLTLVNAIHDVPFEQPSDPHFDLVVRATVGFLDATLKGHTESASALQTLVASAPTLAVLESTPAPGHP